MQQKKDVITSSTGSSITTHFEPPNPLNTAVLFLIFNRPDTTRQVFNAIRQARPPRLYVAADGPREGRKYEEKLCAEARVISKNVDWPCEVFTLFRKKNLGCRYAVSTAIDWFFEHEEQGIILEDDCLPSQSFFWYCEYCLEQYKIDLRIMQVSGFNPFGTWKDGKGFFFSKFGPIWGWATWRRAWCTYDVTMNKWPQIKQARLHYNFCNSFAERIWREKLFDLVNKGVIDTWDYQWSFAKHINNGLTIIPKKNLITNIGFGPEATHHINIVYTTPRKYEVLIDKIISPLVLRDKKYDNNYLKYFAKARIMNVSFLKNIHYKTYSFVKRHTSNIINKFSEKNKIIDEMARSLDLPNLNDICNIQIVNLAETDYQFFCDKTQLFQEKSIRRNPKKSLEFFFSYHLLGIDGADSVLDAAGGDGTYCKVLQKLHSNVQCIVFDQGYTQNQTVDRIDYVGGDIEAIPINSASIDKLTCHHAFEHFQSKKDICFIQEVSRVLNKGGTACIIPLFISDKYIELWNIKKEGTFDNTAQLLLDTSSTLPGAEQDGNFARIYDKSSLQKRIIEVAKKCGLEITIIECKLDGETIPRNNENIGSKLNSPLRALMMLKK